MKRAIILGIIITITITLVGCTSNKLQNEKDIFAAVKKTNKNIKEDSLVINELSKNKKLVFVEDDSNIYAYFINGEQLEPVYFVSKMAIAGQPLAWGYNTTTPPEKPSMLLGIFDDTVIKKITVNGVQEQDIFVISREKEDIFCVFDQELPIPIDIKGYSADGDLLYNSAPLTENKN